MKGKKKEGRDCEREGGTERGPTPDVLLKHKGSEKTTNASRVAKSCLNPLAWADLADSPAAVLAVCAHDTRTHTHRHVHVHKHTRGQSSCLG